MPRRIGLDARGCVGRLSRSLAMQNFYIAGVARVGLLALARNVKLLHSRRRRDGLPALARNVRVLRGIGHISSGACAVESRAAVGAECGRSAGLRRDEVAFRALADNGEPPSICFLNKGQAWPQIRPLSEAVPQRQDCEDHHSRVRPRRTGAPPTKPRNPLNPGDSAGFVRLARTGASCPRSGARLGFALGLLGGRGGGGAVRLGAVGLRAWAEQVGGELLRAVGLLPGELGAAEVTVARGGLVDGAEQVELF